jgi:hypothetical protein
VLPIWLIVIGVVLAVSTYVLFTYVYVPQPRRLAAVVYLGTPTLLCWDRKSAQLAITIKNNEAFPVTIQSITVCGITFNLNRTLKPGESYTFTDKVDVGCPDTCMGAAEAVVKTDAGEYKWNFVIYRLRG